MKSQEGKFAELFQAAQHDLLRYIFGCVPRHNDALDILQETASALWEKFDEYDQEKPFGAWARKFAHVQVLKHCLYRKREKQNLTTYSQQTQQALAAEYEQHVDVLQARSEALAACMATLGDADRELLRQRYFKPTSLREVARATGKKEDQLYRRLKRIRQALLRCIDLRLAEQT